MSERFVYVTYIRTTPETLWEALTSPEWTRRYWVGTHQESTWEGGAAWSLMIPDGRVGDADQVLEIDRPRKLVLAWRNEFMPTMREDEYSRCSYELEAEGATVKLTVVHESGVPGSKLIAGVAQGWPKILSALKTLVETGTTLPGMDAWPEGF